MKELGYGLLAFILSPLIYRQLFDYDESSPENIKTTIGWIILVMAIITGISVTLITWR